MSRGRGSGSRHSRRSHRRSLSRSSHSKRSPSLNKVFKDVTETTTRKSTTSSMRRTVSRDSSNSRTRSLSRTTGRRVSNRQSAKTGSAQASMVNLIGQPIKNKTQARQVDTAVRPPTRAPSEQRKRRENILSTSDHTRSILIDGQQKKSNPKNSVRKVRSSTSLHVIELKKRDSQPGRLACCTAPLPE